MKVCAAGFDFVKELQKSYEEVGDMACYTGSFIWVVMVDVERAEL